MKTITVLCQATGIAVAALLAACSGGGSVNIGSGQTADPGTVDFPIAYVKRTIPEEGDDLRQQRDTAPDADLFFRDRAAPSSAERNITGRITGTDPYDIKDVDVSPDGRRIVFAMRGPLAANQDEKDSPLWQIWEYNIVADDRHPADDLHRVIDSNATTPGNDIGPQYLPGERIVFTSTRQRQSKAVLLDESKPGFEAQTENRAESAFLLHVMDADGGNIHQISFNQSHDLWPSVLADGRVMFTRWDAATGRGMHLYTVNPDGTDLQLLYGARSHQRTEPPDANGVATNTTVQFTRPREMRDGRILTLVRPFTDSDFGGDLVMIDTRTYVESAQPLAAYAGLQGPAPTRATPNEVSTIAGPSVGGRFRSAFPLWDGSNRILVSWSQCRLLDTTVTPSRIVPCTPVRLADPNVQTAPSLYSAFVFDPANNTFKPLFQPVERVMITDLVAAQPRESQPTYLPDHTQAAEDFNPVLVGEGVGVLDIRSVYDFDGSIANTGPGNPDIATVLQRPADQRPARFLRIEKAVSIGDNDLDPSFPDIANAAFGRVNYMREILGYAPIEPDGSVRVRVPSNVAFVISVLDRNGRRISTPHRAWLQLQPGEIRQCNGCHQPAQGGAPDRSHGRSGTSSSGWIGAGVTLPAFPATLVATAAGVLEHDTMAQARARASCIAGSTCSELLSVNLTYDDVWTDDNVRPADDSFSYAYSGTGFTTTPPTSTSCMASWRSGCRIVVNYLRNIHPLWYVDRGANTCTNCHGRTNPVDNSARIPAAQLDFSDVDSDAEPLHKNAYQELLAGDNERDINGQVILIDRGNVDDQGNPILEPIPVPASLVPANARGSTRFFCNNGNGNPCVERFGMNGSHSGRLSAAELRLISEWVDIGAQYFNNPFDPAVPLN